MKRIETRYLVIILIWISACSSGPQPITYGTDGCQFCKMTIMDKKYGAELVTSKGKVFKYDATECMINYTKQNAVQAEKDALFVTNYLDPHDWIIAKEAIFLRSPNLPSPMGQFITAFKSMESVKEVQLELGGEIQNFEEVIQSLNNNQIGIR